MLQYPGIASHAHPPEAAYRLCQPSCSRNVLRNRLVGCAGEATQKVSPVCWPSGSKSAPRGRPTYRLRRPGGSKCGRCGAAFRLRSPGRSKGPPESRGLRGPVGSKSVPQERPIDCVGQVAPQIYAEASPGASQSLVVYSAATDEKTCLL